MSILGFASLPRLVESWLGPAFPCLLTPDESRQNPCITDIRILSIKPDPEGEKARIVGSASEVPWASEPPA
ncbi:Uncharacterized protein HZ326_27232 [Fusarium oxysporum f. sp. albedinis]|nr:Uncharacterized protein HZ326_27232 [Fusarium oxysporum f. sp. albedinis]